MRTTCLRNSLSILFLFTCTLLQAGDVPITSITASETQIVIQYVATSFMPCTISVTDEGSGTNPPRDLDPTLFPNANIDLYRTTASGFRWPTIVNNDGLTRTVVLGGHDEVKQASNGKWYSTALQAATPHRISIACNGGADTVVVEQSTSNIPLGSNYPELPIPAPSNPNPGYPAPTIDWNDRTVKYMDPITGVLMQRVSAPLDIPAFTEAGRPFSFAYDVIGSAWTNPNNALANQTGLLASTSTPNAPLFLANGPDSLGVYCCDIHTTDAQVVLYGKGNSGSEIAEVCWSQDSGQTCASGALDSAPFSTVSQVQASLPSSYPSNQFVSWGTWTGRTGQYDLINQSFSGVNASGSVVTLPSIGTSSGFNIDRAPGSQFTLTNCTSGANVQLTVAHVDSPLQITVTRTGLSNTSCTYQDYGSGIRVILKNSGTLSVSASLNRVVGSTLPGASNGSYDICSKDKVTDIAIDCDGVPRNPPLSGRMCQMFGGEQSIFLVQDIVPGGDPRSNGRMCLQSIGKHGTIQHLYPLANPWLGAKSWMGSDGTNLWTVTKTDTNYKEYVPGVNPVDDSWTYVNASATATPLVNQIVSAGGDAAAAIATGLFGSSFGINGIVGGYIHAANQPGGQDTLCIVATMDASFNLVQAATSWSKYPLRWGACHSSLAGTQSYSGLIVKPLQVFNRQVSLGGPFILPITAIRENGVFKTYDLAISGGTAGTTTTLTSLNHDLAQRRGMLDSGGPYLTCSGGTGGWTSVNGTFHATVPDNNTFVLPVSTSGPMSGTIICSVAPPLDIVGVGAITNASPPVVTISPSWDGNQRVAFVPSNRQLFRDGDAIGFSALNQTTQFYAKAAGNQQFAVYMDSALTQPAAFAAVSAAVNNGVVYHAEACPTASADTLMPSGRLYFDSGSLMNSTPLIRCATLRVRSQPCSEWAASGEQSHYPCPSDPGNPNKSSLQNIQPGDVLYDLAGSDVPDHELLLVLAVTVNSPTSIDLTVMRWYGNDPNWGADYHLVMSRFGVHSPGWTPYMINTLPSVYFDATDPTAQPDAESPIYAGSHHDLGEGGPGLVNLAVPPAGYDDIPNVPFSQYLTTPVTFVHNNRAVWAGDTRDTLFDHGTQQSYPSHRQATAVPSEQVWKADVTALNIANGTGKGVVDTASVIRTITKVSGFQNVYRITNPAPTGVANIKLVPYLMTTGVQYFQDISGPSNCLANPSAKNCITDSSTGKYCEAYAANECVSGSTAGSFYFASKVMYDTGSCYSNNQTLFAPCLYPLWPMAGWLQQIRQTPMDLNGTGVRRLTMGWSLPLTHFIYYNWVASPDAQWGFFSANPVGQKTLRNSLGSTWFAMKLPPFPSLSDTPVLDRTGFVNYPVQVFAPATDTVRVAFGYGENGDINQSYCTTRQETCWTSASAAASNPYVFNSETQSRTSCNLGCIVNVPAIPGRVLYYRVEHSDGTSDAMQAVAIP